MKSHRLGVIAISAALALATTAAISAGSPAHAADAAAVSTPAATTPDFYTPPPSLPLGDHGTLVKAEQFTPNLGSGAPSTKAWRVLYKTTDALGAPGVASGVVLVPNSIWFSFSPRPVVDYAPGSQGLGEGCEPSQQIAAGTEYETANIVSALNKGWSVVMTDYQGYVAGSKSLYLVSDAVAHDVLDMAKAAASVPGAGIDPHAQTAIWGFSEGGQAANRAAQLATSYAPSVNLVGVATGGSVTNLQQAAENLDGGVGTGDVAMAIIGLNNEYPAIGLDNLVNAQGATILAKLKTQCVFPSILDYQSLTVKDFTKSGQTLQQLEQVPAIANAIAAQQIIGRPVPVPVLQYQGQADEFVPIAQNVLLKQQYCALGVTTKFLVYPSEHIATQFQAAPDVISWISDRFGGKTAPSTCATTTPAPTSTAAPKGGDFTVSLPSWPLSGTLSLKNLGATLALPAGATFSGTTDLTTNQLTGQIAAPTFTTTINAYGFVPLTVTVGIQQVGAATGSATLDAGGLLHLSGSTSLIIKLQKVVAVGLLPIVDLPACQTSVPVNLPLTFDGPVSSLGNGSLTLAGQATFPKLQNCGLITDTLNLLFAGPGNAYAFTVKPPAPTVY